jgi:hypothetical protein
MKTRLIASLAVASMLAGSSAFAFGSNPAKEQCKAAYQQELNAAKAQHTHAERKASEKLAKAHYKDCKHQAKH